MAVTMFELEALTVHVPSQRLAPVSFGCSPALSFRSPVSTGGPLAEAVLPLGVALVAARRYVLAPDPRIPTRIGPFDLGDVSHFSLPALESDLVVELIGRHQWPARSSGGLARNRCSTRFTRDALSLRSRASIALRISGIALSRNSMMSSRDHAVSGFDQSSSAQSSASSGKMLTTAPASHG